MDIFVLASVAILAVMVGFWAGRSVQWQIADGYLEDEESPVPAKKNPVEDILLEASAAEELRTSDRRRNAVTRRISYGQVIGSPISGTVTGSLEEGRATARFCPEKGRIYAPASGKITRLYPMGSAIQFRTEFGAELLIRVGSKVDEMHSDFYRCMVMEREVVPKGKLLLEYDVEGLHAEGAGTEVTMSMANGEAGSVTVVQNARVKVGENVMWIRNSGLARVEK